MSELIERLRLAAEDAAGGLPSAEQVDALVAYADALEAELAARQPSGDDREATEAEIDKSARALHMAKCCSLSGDSPHDFPEASELFAAGVVLNAVPRAAAPDAATEDMTVAEFCEALGFVDDSTTPAKLRDIVEPIQWWDSEARDHVECARICEQCGETLARTLCGECHGGGLRDGGNGTVCECGNCGGAGWLHEGCAEVAYADLVAERDAALAAVERVRAAVKPWGSILSAAKGEVLAALDGAPEPTPDIADCA